MSGPGGPSSLPADPLLAGARPLLLVGNKRSGTSLMVNLLNLHPRILVAHEADFVWILFQLWNGRSPDGLEAHPGDEAKGMQATLEHCGGILGRLQLEACDPADVGRAFRHLLWHLNEHGRGDWDLPARKSDLRWVGDKKPAQHTDPRLRPFIRRSLPDARFVHVIRDPRYVVASMREAANRWGRQSVPEYWRGGPSEVASEWARREELVLDLRREWPGRVSTVRLEDLADRPREVLGGLYRHLGVDWPGGIQEKVRQWVWDPNTRHEPSDFEVSGSVARVMAEHGYG